VTATRYERADNSIPLISGAPSGDSTYWTTGILREMGSSFLQDVFGEINIRKATFGKVIFSKVTFGKVTFGKVTFGKVTFGKVTLSEGNDGRVVRVLLKLSRGRGVRR
jgi:hypothetical protein